MNERLASYQQTSRLEAKSFVHKTESQNSLAVKKRLKETNHLQFALVTFIAIFPTNLTSSHTSTIHRQEKVNGTPKLSLLRQASYFRCPGIISFHKAVEGKGSFFKITYNKSYHLSYGERKMLELFLSSIFMIIIVGMSCSDFIFSKIPKYTYFWIFEHFAVFL